MRGLRRSGTASAEHAPPDAARLRRRRRRIVIAAPFVVVLSWAIVSYTAWMLQPTSMRWDARSAEWVRNEVPFGNWLVDHGENIYYSLNAPKTGGPPLK